MNITHYTFSIPNVHRYQKHSLVNIIFKSYHKRNAKTWPITLNINGLNSENSEFSKVYKDIPNYSL